MLNNQRTFACSTTGLSSQHTQLTIEGEEPLMSNTPSSRAVRPRGKATYARRRLAAAVALLAVLAVGFLTWKAYRFWNAPLTAHAGSSAEPSAPTAADTNRFTVLIAGADDRPNEPGRSDTLLVAFVDLSAGQVKLLSMPRDSYIKIPGHGGDKVNAAYAFGQEDLVKQSLAPLLKVPIDYTFVINMPGFEKIVDAVGGVDINVDANLDYDDPYDTPPTHIHLTKGQQHLDGHDALGYVRFRHDSQSDWGRMQRQQNFLRALLKASLQSRNLLRLPSLINTAMDNVRTDMSPSQLSRLALLAKDKLGPEGITGTTLAGDDLWTSEGYYTALHFEEMRDSVRQLAGIAADTSALAQDKQDAAAYNAALPKGFSTYEGLLAAEAAKTSPVKLGGTGQPGNGGQLTPGKTPWQLVVVDASGGAQSKLLDTLKTNGFQVNVVQGPKDVKGTTIVWYNGPKDAADRLHALVPNAKFVHLAPGSGDPPLKLILGQ